MNTNDNDAFEMFLNLEDVKGGFLSKESKAEVESWKESLANDKAQAESLLYDIDDNDDHDDDSFIYDFSDIDNDFLFSDEEGFVDPEAKEVEETTENFQDSEEADDSTDDNANADSVDDYSNDGIELDYTDLVTLPDGTQAMLQDLITNYENDRDFSQRLERVAQEEARIKEEREQHYRLLDLNRLETDILLDDFKDYDWQALAYEDPVAFRDQKLFFDKLLEKKNNILNSYKEYEAQKANQEAEEFNRKALVTRDMCRENIPGWNDELYSNILNHAIEDLGWSEDKAAREIDFGTIQALYNSYRMTESKKIVEKKIGVKRLKTASKTLSANSSAQATAEAETRRRAEARYTQGKMSQEEAFKYLID